MSVEEFAEYVEKMYRVSWRKEDSCTIQEYVKKGYFALDAFDDMMQACPPSNLDDIKSMCDYLDERIHDVFLMKELMII